MPERLRDDFDLWCDQNNTTPSAVLREMIREYGNGAEWPAVQPNLVRVNFRVREDEWERASQRSLREQRSLSNALAIAVERLVS